MQIGDAAADIFSDFFWRNFMVKQVALVALGIWLSCSLSRCCIAVFCLLSLLFAIISGMFDSGHGCTQSFPCFFNWRPRPPWMVPGGQSRVAAAGHRGVPAWAQWGAWKAVPGGMLGPPWRGIAGDAALGSDTRPRPPASSAWCSWWCWGPRSGSGKWLFLFWSSSLSILLFYLPLLSI